MVQAFKKRWKNIMLLLVLLFLVLFLFRFWYGYSKQIDFFENQTEYFEEISFSKRNYASKEYKVKSKTQNQGTVNVDQKYEKIAAVNSISSNFDQDEKATRKTIEKYNAIIQFEQKLGNLGNRKSLFAIGVPPENFDDMYQDLIKVGRVQSKQITKKDKTNEYKELNAKKQSLEKIRNSLMELKSKGGRIDEYISLDNRILEIEQELQDLGVSLGNFDDENEFCTVQFSLLEGRKLNITMIHRVKVALEWTVKMQLRIVTVLLFMALFSYISLLIFDKIKVYFKK